MYIKAHKYFHLYHVRTLKLLGICKPCWFHSLWTLRYILIDDRTIHVYKNRSCQMWVLYKLFLFSPVLGKKYDFLFRFPKKYMFSYLIFGRKSKLNNNICVFFNNVYWLHRVLIETWRKYFFALVSSGFFNDFVYLHINVVWN